MNQAQTAFTSGSISNATGNPIAFVTSHDWEGALQHQAPYPKTIANGQAGQFSHSGRHSKGAVVYRSGGHGRQYEFLVSWKNDSTHKVYTMIRDQGHNWNVDLNYISSYLDSGSSSSLHMEHGNGWSNSASISSGGSVASLGATFGPAP